MSQTSWYDMPSLGDTEEWILIQQLGHFCGPKLARFQNRGSLDKSQYGIGVKSANESATAKRIEFELRDLLGRRELSHSTDFQTGKMELEKIFKIKEKQLCNWTVHEVFVQWKG